MSDKVWMFDVDGTLCFGIGENELHKTAALWLEKHKPQRVALCTNQGGVGRRYWMEPRPDEGYDGFGHDSWPNLPTEADVHARMEGLAAQIRAITGGEVKWYASFAYKSRKEIHPPHLKKLAMRSGHKAGASQNRECCFVPC